MTEIEQKTNKEVEEKAVIGHFSGSEIPKRLEILKAASSAEMQGKIEFIRILALNISGKKKVKFKMGTQEQLTFLLYLDPRFTISIRADRTGIQGILLRDGFRDKRDYLSFSEDSSGVERAVAAITYLQYWFGVNKDGRKH